MAPAENSSIEFARLQTVFEYSPVSLWQEDFSAIYSWVEARRSEGVTDFGTYFQENPQAVEECASLIKILDVNQASLDLHAAPSKEFLLKNLVHTFTEKSFQVFQEELLSLIDGSPSFGKEAQLKNLDGDLLEIFIKTSVDPDTPRWANVLVAITDLTPLKTAQKALRKSEINFRSLFDQAPVCYQSLGPDGRLLQMNQTWLDTMGYTREQALELKFPDLLSDDQLPIFRLRFSQFQAMGKINNVRYELRKADGSKIPVIFDGRIVSDEDGHFLRTHCVFRDLSNQMELEKERDSLSRQNAMLLGASGECIIGMDTDSLITFANPSVERTTGWPVDDIIGKNEHELFHHSGVDGTTIPHADCPILTTVNKGKAVAGESFFWRKDGTSFPVDYTCHPIFEKGEITGSVLNFSDISEKRELENKFQVAQKMEAVGQLAGGIAHDFNNILHALLSHLDFVQDPEATPDERDKDLAMVRECVEKASALTRQLLAFSRRQVLNKEKLDANDLVSRLLEMMRRLIREDIQIEFTTRKGLHPLVADANQIEQVLLNLCLNAQDAMPEGGQIHLRASNFVVDRPFQREHPWAKDGQYVLLEVEDTGHGIAQENLSQVFTPFFSTKGPGRGTGLGLASAYGIIKQHDGFIHVYSEINKGTSFKVYLPAQEGYLIRKDQPRPTAKTVGGQETILLAEDDPLVLESTRRFLEGAGYTVVTAPDGQEAIQIHQQRGDEIDLYLLDVIMPRKSGHQVQEAVLATDPEARILFSSGYSNETLNSGNRLSEGQNLIRKPYSPQQLLVFLRKILDAPPTSG